MPRHADDEADRRPFLQKPLHHRPAGVVCRRSRDFERPRTARKRIAERDACSGKPEIEAEDRSLRQSIFQHCFCL